MERIYLTITKSRYEYMSSILFSTLSFDQFAFNCVPSEYIYVYIYIYIKSIIIVFKYVFAFSGTWHSIENAKSSNTDSTPEVRILFVQYYIKRWKGVSCIYDYNKRDIFQFSILIGEKNHIHK